MLRLYRFGFAAGTLSALLLLASGRTHADLIVVPNSLESIDGNVASNLLTDSSAASLRYQQVFAATQFSKSVSITQIAFRLDAGLGTAFSETLPNARIALSTTSKAPDALSSAFADNVGLDEQVVFTGDLLLTSGNGAGPGNTRAFDILITFSSSYSYDPSLGSLLLDFQRDAASLPVQFDAQAIAGDSVSRAIGFRNNAGASAVDTGGLVVRFTVTAVPEPSSVVLMSFGALGLSAFVRRPRGRPA